MSFFFRFNISELLVIMNLDISSGNIYNDIRRTQVATHSRQGKARW